MNREKVDELRTLALNTKTVEFFAPQDGGCPELRRTFDAAIIADLIDTLRGEARLPDSIQEALNSGDGTYRP